MISRRTTFVLAAIGLSLAAGPAFAASGSTLFGGLDTLLQNVITALSGTTGRAIATVALIVLAIAWLTGRIHWHTALVWACAVAVIVGAPTIVAAIA
jgi:type IV secretion system protein VirB2